MTLPDRLRAQGYPEFTDGELVYGPGPAKCPDCGTTKASVFVRSGGDLVCLVCFRRGDGPPSPPSLRRTSGGAS
jgi:hypothetical protein